MGLKTWEKKFYPTTALAASKGSEIKAVKHSLRKWIGLRPENLQKHKIFINEFVDVADEAGRCLTISESSCSLCRKHRTGYPGEECDQCPLLVVRGGRACFETLESEKRSPWHEWTRNSNPEPMIHWLELARNYAESRNEPKTSLKSTT